MKVGKEKKEKYERQYWLWVTRPKYYLDKNGDSGRELDPLTGVEDLWRSLDLAARKHRRAIWPYCGGAKQTLTNIWPN